MQSRQVLLLPDTGLHEPAAIEIEEIQSVVPVELHIVGIQVSMADPGPVKTLYAAADTLPEGIVTGPLTDSICQRPDSRDAKGQQVGPVEKARPNEVAAAWPGNTTRRTSGCCLPPSRSNCLE